MSSRLRSPRGRPASASGMTATSTTSTARPASRLSGPPSGPRISTSPTRLRPKPKSFRPTRPDKPQVRNKRNFYIVFSSLLLLSVFANLKLADLALASHIHCPRGQCKIVVSGILVCILYSASQKKQPWNNGMLRASFGVYDYYHIYFMKYD